MDYLVPAWHELLHDSAFAVPDLQFDDAINNMKLLQSVKRPVGLIITDYQPHLTAQLNMNGLIPKSIFSVFDYLQGIYHYNGGTINYYDFPWPDGAEINFNAFHAQIVVNDEIYAQVVFDTDGRIAFIEYYQAKHLDHRLVIDSRGFISRNELHDQHDNHIIDIYYDETGQWRLKHDLRSDQVVVNPIMKPIVNYLKYDHLTDLLKEITDRLLQGITDNDRLLVSLDDHSRIPQEIFIKPQTRFYVSNWHPVTDSFAKLKKNSEFKPIFDSNNTAQKLKVISPQIIPPFYARFNLGHSQRCKRQQIIIFVDDLPDQELYELSELAIQRMIQSKGKDELYLLSFTNWHYNRAQNIHNKLVSEHEDDFELFDPNDKDAEKELVENQDVLHLVFQVKQCKSSWEAFKLLDKARILIDWGQHPNSFLQTAAVSIGFPLIQRVQTDNFTDHQNGLLCPEIKMVSSALNYYLDSLKNWNRALTYNVQELNKNSSSNIIDKYDQVWKREEDVK